MTNYEIEMILKAFIYLTLLGGLIALMVIMGKMEQEAKKREHDYIKTLNEHDRAVIMEYKTKTSWIQKGRK